MSLPIPPPPEISPLSLHDALPISLRELPPRDLGAVGIVDRELLAQHLAERPIHDGRAVGGTSSGAEDGSVGTIAEAALQLDQQSRLADPRLADDRHDVRAALAGHA